MHNTVRGEIMDLHPVSKKKTTHKVVEGKREAPGRKLRKTYTLVGAWFGEYLLGRRRADGELFRGWQIPLLAELEQMGVLDGGPCPIPAALLQCGGARRCTRHGLLALGRIGRGGGGSTTLRTSTFRHCYSGGCVGQRTWAQSNGGAARGRRRGAAQGANGK
jgi:hypothetical protein